MLLSSTSFAARSFLLPHVKSLSASFHVSLVCGDNQHPLELGISNAEIHYIEIARKPSLGDIFAIIRYIKLANSVQPSLILTITPKMALVALAFKFCLPSSIVVGHYFTGQVWAEYKGLRRAFYKTLDRIFIRFLDFSLCDGIGQRDYLISQGLCESKDISVLGSGSIAGVSINCNQPIRSIKHMQNDPVRLLYAGRLNTAKGLDDILYVFKRLLADEAHFKLTIVGPDEQDYCHKFQNFLTLYPDRFIYAGQVDDVSDFYAASDLLLLPSRREGFGSVVIEAARYGVPTIAYDIYGLRNTILDRETGFLAMAFDRDAYYSIVRRLIESRNEIEVVGQRAFIYTKLNFSQDVVTSNLKTFITQKITHQS
jgi:glycosyltransferase involved in cell wall biosynthesis